MDNTPEIPLISISFPCYITFRNWKNLKYFLQFLHECGHKTIDYEPIGYYKGRYAAIYFDKETHKHSDFTSYSFDEIDELKHMSSPDIDRMTRILGI